MEVPSGWDDAAARSPGGHVLQSSVWAALRERQGWRAEYVRIARELPLALVLWRDALAGQRIAYVPRGPIIAPGDSAGLRHVLLRLADLARERGAVFLKVDPE
ncbi:MAG TPA: peptidoglycan bridge formation glycyltransferase FemA/FemB family protein, partial [Candidatus Limnocylindria bacterium]